MYQRFEVIELSFWGDPIFHEQADYNVYTNGSKCEFGVGSAYRGVVSGGTIYNQDSFSLPSYT